MKDSPAPPGDNGERPELVPPMAPSSIPTLTTQPTIPIWSTSPTSRPPNALAPPASATQRRRLWVVRRVFKWLFIFAMAWAFALFGLVVAYRSVTPPITATILGQRLSGQQISQRWIPLDQMSPNLISAVIASEDSGFCRHRGVDWRELAEVVESARDGTTARGGSTIPMQTVKNLFLWSSKSYLRKALEIPITLVADPIWGKRRTLEIYLNIAEWGPGVFGAEAAAQYHFKKSSARLTEMEAALLAAALPSPIARDSGDPGAQQQRLAQRLVERMRQSPAARLACLA